MSAYYKHSGKVQAGASWRDDLEEIRAAREELREYSGLMTSYERSVIERSIKERADSCYGKISGGILSEYYAALGEYQDARKRLDQVASRELSRWDSERLGSEIDTFDRLVNLAIQRGGDVFAGDSSIAAQLESLVNQAQRSGDIHKQRAAYEVIKAALPRVTGEDRIQVNHLARQAERELTQMRVTDEMREAISAIEITIQDFAIKRDETIAVGEVLTGHNPTEAFSTGDISKALRRVTVDKSGENIVILPEDDWRVNGVYFGKDEKSE